MIKYVPSFNHHSPSYLAAFLLLISNWTT